MLNTLLLLAGAYALLCWSHVPKAPTHDFITQAHEGVHQRKSDVFNRTNLPPVSKGVRQQDFRFSFQPFLKAPGMI